MVRKLVRSGSGIKRKTRLVIFALAFGFIGILVGSAVTASQFAAPARIDKDKFGGLGSDHKHSAFLIVLDGKLMDFSQPKYQVRSPYMHVENGDGTTLHRHSLFAPFGEFITSLRMDIKDGCFIMDDGTQYCNSSEKMLRFIVNGAEQQSIMDYIPKDNDRILIHYGDINDIAQINTEMKTLLGIPIGRN